MADDRHSRRDGDDYAQALSALLPTGIAWDRRPGTVLARVVRGLAGFWGFVDGRIADFLEREADPRQTLELLPEWERAFGLPDKCMSVPLTLAARRQILVQRMTKLGAADRQFFLDLAAELGYVVRIVERLPFQFGVTQFGDTRVSSMNGGWPNWEIGPPETRYSWFIQVLNAPLIWWRFGEAEIGIDPHLKFSFATELECVIRRWKPAHTELLFDYSHMIAGEDWANALFGFEGRDRMSVVGKIATTGRLAANEITDSIQTVTTSANTGTLAALDAVDTVLLQGIPHGAVGATEAVDTLAALGNADVFVDSLLDENNTVLTDENDLPIIVA